MHTRELETLEDVDAHLDLLEDIGDGNLFAINQDRVARLEVPSILKAIEKKILAKDEAHSVILIEEPPHRHESHIQSNLKRLGRRLDGKKTHTLHAFFIPPETYKALRNEVPDWDEVFE